MINPELETVFRRRLGRRRIQQRREGRQRRHDDDGEEEGDGNDGPNDVHGEDDGVPVLPGETHVLNLHCANYNNVTII